MKRVWLANALGGLGVASGILAVRRRTRTPWLTVLTYHRVMAEQAVTDALDPEVVTPAAAFDRQLEILREHFSVVGLDEVLAHLRGVPLPASPLLITFDDGYRDNHDVALPLLRKHGLRAVFFVATSFVDERRVFWWDRVNHVLRTCTRDAVRLSYPRPQVLRLGPDAHARAAAIDTTLKIIKTEYDLDLPRFLEHLELAAGVGLDRDHERQLADAHVMTWEQVRALRRAGMDVQSHTHTHRVLETLSPNALVAELCDARAVLEQALGEPVRAMSYPVGRHTACSAALRDAMREAGYAIGFSNRGGVNLRGRLDPFDLRRIPLEGMTGDLHFASVLALPPLAY